MKERRLPVVPSALTHRLKWDQHSTRLTICVTLSLEFHLSDFDQTPPSSAAARKHLFGSHFHVNPMNFNGSDRAVTMGRLRKQRQFVLVAETVLLSGLITPAPIYHPATATRDGPPLAEADLTKRKETPNRA